AALLDLRNAVVKTSHRRASRRSTRSSNSRTRIARVPASTTEANDCASSIERTPSAHERKIPLKHATTSAPSLSDGKLNLTGHPRRTGAIRSSIRRIQSTLPPSHFESLASDFGDFTLE